jgi:hypothetical protein
MAFVFTVSSVTQAQSSPISVQAETASKTHGQKQAASLGFTELKTGFGYVRMTNIKRPAKYKCSSASIAVDIRNMSKLNIFGLSIDLLDDFDNVVGHAFVDTWDEKTETRKKNGVYKTKMNICAKNQKWTGSNFFDGPIKSISKSNSYSLDVTGWLYKDWWGSVTYTLRK